jgi:protein-tyrosine phosphatase
MTSQHLSNQALHDREVAGLRHRNFRDLGGLPTRNGLTVVPGRFFRGSSPSGYDLAERQVLASLNLRTILDLRTRDEARRSSNLGSVAGAQVFHQPLFDAARPNWIAPHDQNPRATAERYFEMLSDGLYVLATVAAQLAQARAVPFLVCCTAGRDRTGIVVACLLDLLDVSDEAISSDYAESDSFDPQSGRSQADTILEFLGLLRGHHGSTLQMLRSRGLPQNVVGILRKELLVPKK